MPVMALGSSDGSSDRQRDKDRAADRQRPQPGGHEECEREHQHVTECDAGRGEPQHQKRENGGHERRCHAQLIPCRVARRVEEESDNDECTGDAKRAHRSVMASDTANAVRPIAPGIAAIMPVCQSATVARHPSPQPASQVVLKVCVAAGAVIGPRRSGIAGPRCGLALELGSAHLAGDATNVVGLSTTTTR